MKKKLEVKEEVAPIEPVKVNVVSPITESFGSGEVNILKDKLNEVIKYLNG